MRPTLASSPSRIAVVDDDVSIGESLPELLKQLGFVANSYPSAEAFLASDWAGQIDGLILDVNLPGMSGPDLQRELMTHNPALPIIFITAHVDEKIRRQVFERGARGLLIKPFSEVALLGALGSALPAR